MGRCRTTAFLVTMTLGAIGGLTPSNMVLAASASTPPTTEPAEEPPPIWGELGADGEVTVDVARQAFADVFGPIGDIQSSGSEHPAAIDPSGVLQWIESVWEELTADEQADAQAILDEFVDPFAENAAGLGGARMSAARDVGAGEPRECTLIEVGQPLPAQTLESNRLIAERLLELYDAFNESLGRAGPPRLAVCAQRNASLEHPIMKVYAANTSEPGAAVDHCNVYYPLDAAFSNDVELTMRLSIIMARCYWSTASGASLGEARSRLGAWFIDGAFLWAAATVAEELIGTTGAMNDDLWNHYLENPSIPLPERVYDAIGFFAQVDQADGQMWARWDAVTHSRDSSEAFVAAGGSGGINDTWASGYLRDPGRGPDWDITGPGVTDGRYEPDDLDVPVGATVVVAAGAYTPALATVSTDADLIAFTHTGRLRVADASIDEAGFQDRVMCTRPDGDCRCPDSPDEESPNPLGSPFVVAITDGNQAAEVAMVGLSLDDVCERELLVAPNPCTLITQAEADAVSGFATLPTLQPDDGGFAALGTGQSCPFVADTDSPFALVRITVIDLGADAAGKFAAWKATQVGMDSGSVEGLGDENFYFSSPGAVGIVFIRVQNLFISVSVITPDGPEQATRLAELALSRL